MVLKSSLILIIVTLNLFSVQFVSGNLNKNGSSLAAIKLPDHPSFDTISSSNSGCSFTNQENFGHSEDDEEQEQDGKAFLQSLNPNMESVKLHLKHHKSSGKQHKELKDSLVDSTVRDLTRIQTLHKRVMEKKNQNTLSRLQKSQKQPPATAAAAAAPPPEYISSGYYSNQMVATLESGVTLGSGEYFMDVFIGTPPKHFSLILDTGSDLNWIQCEPCHACFDQSGPHYNPKDSASYKDINCEDPRCNLVSSPDPPQTCTKDKNQTCPYFYWYGDSSNTTGDFALETFTVNLTNPNGKPELKIVENVMFGCGHWNRGLFHGAAGLLGLGRGPLSFSSQLQSLYGHSFSYCLVDRNSDTNVTSKLIFGADKDLLGHPGLNFTAFVGGKENPVDTFYYLQIKSLMVGGEILKEIPEQTWALSSGGGGAIIDSGTTLTYFAEPAYGILREAFEEKIKGYPKVEGYAPLGPCYNVSELEKMEVPDFGILFGDGAVWNFPVENYFIQIEPERVACLAILGTPRNGLSIIGNYQQQNFHILYDTKNSRLGYAPMNCADV